MAHAVSSPLAEHVTAPRFYHPELDVLRFFAAFSVFAFHSLPKDAGFLRAHGVPRTIATLWVDVIGSGGFGVDLFFVLSSFLITTLLLKERERFGTLNVRAFYMRRILRIWPLYLFFVGVSAVLPYFDASQHFGWKYTLAYLLLAGNWMVVLHGAPLSVALPLWSVSVEEQFYLTWPLVVRNASKRVLVYAAAGMLAVSFLARVVLASHGIGQDAIWCNTLTRLDPIALGFLLAIVNRKKEIRPSIPARVGAILLGAASWLLVTHFCGLHESPVRPIGIIVGYPLAALGATAILIGVYNTGWNSKVLVYLGKISFGIYVYHYLGLFLAHKVFGSASGHLKTFAADWMLAVALTFAMAALSYKFLESPFLSLKERFTYTR